MICDDQHDHQDAAERVPVVQVARDREVDELPCISARQAGAHQATYARRSLGRRLKVQPWGLLETFQAKDHPIRCEWLSRNEFILRDQEVFRRRTLANAACGVVVRAVAGAEPAAEIAFLADSGMQPRWVQTPTMTTRYSLPSTTRFSSVAGVVFRQVRIAGQRVRQVVQAQHSLPPLPWVRLRMNTGLPRHITVIDCPSSIGRTSTSMEASARTRRHRVHLIDERPCQRCRADRAHRAGRDIEEIAACGFDRILLCQGRVLFDLRARRQRRSTAGPLRVATPEVGGTCCQGGRCGCRTFPSTGVIGTVASTCPDLPCRR
jgi:hypothetical protein